MTNIFLPVFDDPQSFEITKPLTNDFQNTNIKKILQERKNKKYLLFFSFFTILIFLAYVFYSIILIIPKNSFGYDYNKQEFFKEGVYFFFNKPLIIQKFQSEIFISDFVLLQQNHSLNLTLKDDEYVNYIKVEIFYFINKIEHFEFCKENIFNIWLEKINFNKTNDDFSILDFKIYNYSTTTSVSSQIKKTRVEVSELKM
jgi:hypothetical protein